MDEITSGDPRWWSGPDVDKMINEMNYTLSNSKYIQLSTHMSMEDVFWQTTILLRGLLDRKQETMYSTISINYSINGSSTMSVFDAVMVLVTLMDWKLVDANGRSLKGSHAAHSHRWYHNLQDPIPYTKNQTNRIPNPNSSSMF